MFTKDCKNGAKCHYMRTKGLSPITVFEMGTKLTFKFPFINHKTMKHENMSDIYILSVKKGRLNAYSFARNEGKKHLANISPNPMLIRNTLSSKINTHYYGHKFKDGQDRELKDKEVEEKRLYTVGAHHLHLRKWIVEKLKSYGIKYSIKNIKNLDLSQIIKMGCYPILNDLYKHSGNDHSYLLDFIPTRKMRELKSVRDITKIVFKSTNKRLVREVAQSFKREKSSLICLGMWIKDSLPIDYYKDFQEIRGLYTLNSAVELISGKNQVQLFLENYNPRRIVSLLESCTDFHDLYDAASQWNIMKTREGFRIPDSPRSVRELHDLLSIDFRRMKTKNYNLPIPKGWEELNNWNIIADDKFLQLDICEGCEPKPPRKLTFVLPSSSHELVEWGQRMSNCVASYAERVLEGKCIILGIKENNDLVYCIEIRKGQIEQFKGRRNTEIDYLEQSSILRELIQRKLISVNTFETKIEDRDEAIQDYIYRPYLRENNEQTTPVG